MAEVTEVVAEAAEEVAEEAIEVAEVARSLTSRELKFLAGGVVLGVAVGGVVGYFVTEKRLRTKYEEIAEEEIAEAKDAFRKRLVAREPKPSLEEVGEQVAETKAEYKDKAEGYGKPNLGGPSAAAAQEEGAGAHPAVAVPATAEEPDSEVPEAPHPEPAEVVEQNVFADRPEWDYELEMSLRRPEYPYVIHIDERQEKDYVEATFTYYEGDDVLVNESDEVVEDRDRIVGETNLEKFGHGSGSPDIVFIRHDGLKIQVEVVRHHGSYAEVVHGFVRHADDATSGRMHRRRPKFDDD